MPCEPLYECTTTEYHMFDLLKYNDILPVCCCACCPSFPSSVSTQCCIHFSFNPISNAHPMPSFPFPSDHFHFCFPLPFPSTHHAINISLVLHNVNYPDVPFLPPFGFKKLASICKPHHKLWHISCTKIRGRGWLL